MALPFEFEVGLRYAGARHRGSFVSTISLVSMLGIALGITALITVLSVMNGFQSELRERILGMVSHATISGFDGSLRDWEQAVEEAQSVEGVVAAAPYVERETLLQGRRISGALVRGIAPAFERKVSELEQSVTRDSLDRLIGGEYGIILGADLALALGVDVGDKVTVFAPALRVTPAGVLPQVKRFTVRGLIRAGMHEFDRGLALVHIEDAQRLLRMPERVTGIRLRTTDLFDAIPIAATVRQRLPDAYRISDWTQRHANLFQAVRMEKTVMFVILSLIIAVAAFNIISTLVMMVTDKRPDIAILRTLGARRRSIMLIFICVGSAIGILGALLGLLGGTLLASNIETIVPAIEELIGRQFLSSEIYYISELPSEMRMTDVIGVTVLAMVLSVLATVYPAWRAAATHPVEALRHE